MIDLPSEKITHKFLLFLVDFIRKFVLVFYLKTFLRSPENALFKKSQFGLLSLNSRNCTCM